MDRTSELRLFVAIELSPELRTAVEDAARRLRAAVTERLKAGGASGTPLKWVAVDNLHITLKFLGETPRHVLPDIEAAVAAAAAAARPLTLRVGGSGGFPTSGKPHVLWLGAELEPAPLKPLRRALDDELAHLGFARETRPFSAHLTVARVRETAPPDDVRLIGEGLQRHRVGDLGEQQVDAIALIRSELFPSGPRYTPLARFALGTGARLDAAHAAAATAAETT